MAQLATLCRRLVCETISGALGVPIPKNLPIVGSDAFETATGVHAAAVIKAYQKGADWLADRIYSSVPASAIGRRQQIKVGAMSGRSNVAWWLKEHGHEVNDDVVLTVECPTRNMDYGEFKDALDFLSYYADRHYLEVLNLAQQGPTARS